MWQALRKNRKNMKKVLIMLLMVVIMTIMTACASSSVSSSTSSYKLDDIVENSVLVTTTNSEENSVTDSKTTVNSDEDNVELVEESSSYEEESYYSSWSVTLYNPGVSEESWGNIKRCIDDINNYGLVIPAGTTWSWCYTPITSEGTSLGLLTTWYPESVAYGGDGVATTAPGGGVCQVATGIMQVCRDALTDSYGNCSMVYGVNYFDHSGPVAYAVRGDEAAVNYGSCDLTIPNTYDKSMHIFGFYDEANRGTISLYCDIY